MTVTIADLTMVAMAAVVAVQDMIAGHQTQDTAAAEAARDTVRDMTAGQTQEQTKGTMTTGRRLLRTMAMAEADHLHLKVMADHQYQTGHRQHQPHHETQTTEMLYGHFSRLWTRMVCAPFSIVLRCECGQQLTLSRFITDFTRSISSVLRHVPWASQTLQRIPFIRQDIQPLRKFAAATAAQRSINRLLGREQPDRVLSAPDLNVHRMFRGPDPSHLPDLTDQLEQMLGIKIELDANRLTIIKREVAA